LINVDVNVNSGSLVYNGTCYFILSTVDQPGNHEYFDIPYAGCAECGQNVTPCPTITITNTTTPTPTVSVTQTVTPSVTSTLTVTPSQTVTITSSVTPSVTASNTQTPTNTASPGTTPSSTPTLTPSSTDEICSNNLCVNIQSTGLSGYNGTYTIAGSYNSRDYWTGSTGVIYYNGTRWCISTQLVGDCVIPSNLTSSECPNFDSSILTTGICVPVTPTPTLTSSLTPSVTVSPTTSVTSTPTNTTSPTYTPTITLDLCENFDVVISISVLPTLTPTPSLTLQITPTPFEIDGVVKFPIFNNPFECGEVGLFSDCNTDQEYYLALPITYEGNEINEGMAITVFLQGYEEQVCIVFNERVQGSSSDYINSITSVSQSGCDSCGQLQRLVPVITPSLTVSATQTLTPSRDLSKVVYVYRRCEDGILVIQNTRVNNLPIGQSFRSDNVCYTFEDIFSVPFNLKSGDRYVEYDFNFIGSDIELFDNCEMCNLINNGENNTKIVTEWSFSSCYNNVCDVQGPETEFYLMGTSIESYDGKQIWSNESLTMNYNPGRYVKIENDVYYIQMVNNKSVLKYYCKKGKPC